MDFTEHIITDLYLLVLEKASGGSIFYAENGYNSFKEIAVSYRFFSTSMTVRMPKV